MDTEYIEQGKDTGNTGYVLKPKVHKVPVIHVPNREFPLYRGPDYRGSSVRLLGIITGLTDHIQSQAAAKDTRSPTVSSSSTHHTPSGSKTTAWHLM